MCKKIICAVLTLVLLIGLVPAAAIPASAATSGNCGTGLTYKITDTTLTIAGKGTMSLKAGVPHWDAEKNNIERIKFELTGPIVIPAGAFSPAAGNYTRLQSVHVNKLNYWLGSTFGDSPLAAGGRAHNFYINETIQGMNSALEIPNGIQKIPARAFAGATIKKLTLPGSLRLIEDSAFENCYQLGNITIPNSVHTIGNNAFAGCNAFGKVKLPDSLVKLGNGAFQNCANLGTVLGGNKLTTMGVGAFRGCKSLSSVALSTELTSISTAAFADCVSLQEIKIPGKVATIEAGAFQNTGLKGISFPKSVTTINGSAFAGCENLSYVDVPTVKSWVTMNIIGDSPLNTAKNLRIGGKNNGRLEIPGDVVTIPAGRFANARNIKVLIIPDSVQKIGSNAFYDCQSLQTVKIGNSLAVIEPDAFKDCHSLTKVEVSQTQWPTMDIQGVTEDSLTGKLSGGNATLVEAYYNTYGKPEKPGGPSAGRVAVSQALADMVAERSPFTENAYEYPVGSGHYYIGYGSDSIAGAKITREEAKRVLKDETLTIAAGTIADYFPGLDPANNSSAEATRKREALAAHAFRVGYVWVKDPQHPLHIAVDNGWTGYKFLEAMCADAPFGSQEFLTSLCDGNLYLNGKYSNTVPEEYGYVRLDPNEGKPGRSSVMIYDKSAFPTDSINNLSAEYDPTRLNHKFVGWFTAPSGGQLVTHADASFNGKTLYAHWQYDEGSVPGSKDVSYQLPTVMVEDMCLDANKRVKVFTKPEYPNATNGSQLMQSIDNNSLMNIVAEYVDDSGKLWVKIQNSGWTCLGNNPINMVKSGTVKLEPKQRLNVFRNNSGYIDKTTRVASLRDGNTISVVEFKKVEEETWGRIWFLDRQDETYKTGWVDLAHVEMDKLPEANPDSPNGKAPISAGKVVGTDKLRVRADYNVQAQIYTYLPRGREVDIYEKAEANNGVEWALIDEGWVCMQYIEEKVPEGSIGGSNGTGELGSDTNTTPLATGQVIGNVLLYIRSAPGAQNKDLGTLTGGTKLTIYQTKMFNGAQWGRMERGWVCLNYVKLDKNLPAPDVSNGQSTPSETVVGKARVINCEKINLRAGASIGTALQGTIPVGYEVEYFETTQNEGFTWYHTRRGWLRGDYIQDLGKQSVPNSPATPSIPGVGPVVPGAPATVGTVTGYDTVNVRADADLGSKVVTELKKGSRVYIRGSKVTNGHTWYKIDQGYISSDYVAIGAMAGNEAMDGTTEVANGVYAKGTVAAAGVKTYQGPSTGYKNVRTLALGAQVTVYEQQLSGGVAWGRIGGSEWVNLAFITLNGSGVTGTGTMGMVANANHAVRIRRSPSIDGAQMCTILVGSPVEILEVQNNWGRTPQGWISMDHVVLTGSLPTPPLNPAEPSNPTNPTVPDANKPKPDANRGIPFDFKGTTKKQTYLQIIPGVLGDYDAEIGGGQPIVITKLDKVDGKLWGLIEGGWVDMNDIELSNYIVSKNAQIVWQDASTTHAVGVINKADVENIVTLEMDEAKKVWGQIASGWIELTQITELSGVSTSFLVKTSTGADAYVYAYSDTTSERAEQPLKAGSAIAISSIAMDAQGTGLMIKVAEGWIMAANANVIANASVKPEMAITYSDQNRTTPAGFRYNGNTVTIAQLGLSASGIPMGRIEGTPEWIELSVLFTP